MRNLMLVAGVGAWGGLAVAGAGLAGAWFGLAHAQPQPQAVAEEVVVTAQYKGKELRRLSVPVSYRDLDLTTAKDRETLKRRVKDTAKEACRRLGETDRSGNLPGKSCEQAAVDGAGAQLQFAFAHAKPRARASTTP